MSELASYGSTESSQEIGLETDCMKTGIPPFWMAEP
jgi:hypothetical protein